MANVIFYKDHKILHHHMDTNIICIKIVVNTGSFNEGSFEYGVSHFLEHMFFKGTKHKSYKKVNGLLSKYGYVNGYTSRDTTVYYICCLRKNFENAFKLLLEMFFLPAFPTREFKKEKTVILEEYREGLDDPRVFFFDTLVEQLYGYKRGHNIIGNEDSIRKMTINNIKKYIHRNYTTDNVLFSVVGNIGEDEVLHTFSSFLDINKCYLKSGNNKFNNKYLIDKSPYSFNHKSDQAYVSLVTDTISSIDNINRNYILSIFNNGFGCGGHSLLYEKIREELGFCYNIGSWYESYNKTSLFGICGTMNRDNVDKSIFEITMLLKKVKERGFSEELLEISKENCIYNLTYYFENSANYSDIISDVYFKNDGIIIDYDEQVKRVNKITNNNIKEFTNTLDNFKLVVMNKDK